MARDNHNSVVSDTKPHCRQVRSVQISRIRVVSTPIDQNRIRTARESQIDHEHAYLLGLIDLSLESEPIENECIYKYLVSDPRRMQALRLEGIDV